MAITIEESLSRRQHNWLGWLTSRQAFWVFIAVVLACIFLSFATDSFATPKNLFNITRNCTFVAVIALGMTIVIITGGIDLSVGSVLCLCSMILAVVMHAGFSIYVGIFAALSGRDKTGVLAEFGGANFSAFKNALVDLAVGLGDVAAKLRRALAELLRIEIPLDLYQAINQAAAAATMPTAALATMWLLHMLELRRPDLHVRGPYRSGIEQFERRPRRPGELPDNRSFDEIVRRPWDEDDEPEGFGVEEEADDY